MSKQGRSLDDLPLAAYSTGVVEDEPDEEVAAEPSHLSQQEAIALAMGVEPPASAEPGPAAARGGARSPRRSLPRPSLPKPSLPRMPRMGRGRAAAVAESPFGVASSALAMPVPQYQMPTSSSPAVPAAPAIPGRSRRPGLGGIGASLRNPRTAVRDPRVLFGGMIAVGVVLLGVSLLGGGNPAAGPGLTPARASRPGPGRRARPARQPSR